VTWWAGLLATVRRKTPRERFEEMTETAKRRIGAQIYDSYPSDPEHEDRDEYWVQIVTRGPNGRFMVERLQLQWPLALTDMKSERARDRLLNELTDAFFRLRDRKAQLRRG
jgi:hypothetical protein